MWDNISAIPIVSDFLIGSMTPEDIARNRRENLDVMRAEMRAMAYRAQVQLDLPPLPDDWQAGV